MKEYKDYVEYSIIRIVNDCEFEYEGQFYETREEAESELAIYRKQFPTEKWEIEEHHGTIVKEI